MLGLKIERERVNMLDKMKRQHAEMMGGSQHAGMERGKIY